MKNTILHIFLYFFKKVIDISGNPYVQLYMYMVQVTTSVNGFSQWDVWCVLGGLDFSFKLAVFFL